MVAALLACTVTLSGCTFLPQSPPYASSTPTGETVTAELQPFYEQVLKWSPCESTFQCATATVPMDWKNPADATVDIALIRSTATGTRLGSVLVNPGGPGGSGYDLIRDGLDFATSNTLRGSYDVVGFDPRGVGRSSAVSCYSSPSELDAVLFGIPKNPVGSDAYIAELEAQSAAFGKACLTHTGKLLQFVDTDSAARDLDVLRAALGDKKLNYLGYSYGTLLGATYASIFPAKTGRLVLDGALDPTTSDFDISATQAKGFESALRAYLKDCRTAKDCPFPGTVDQAMADVRDLIASVGVSPIRASDGRELGAQTLFTAIVYPLYSKSDWKYLTQLFTSVGGGSADFAFQLADAYFSRTAKGTYTDNSAEAFTAINCLDYSSSSDPSAMRADAAKLTALAPTFGPSLGFGGTGCFEWPFPSTRVHEKITAAGSGPIIVVGTTNDPATPYVWAKSLASQLQNGHLVTFHGEGHTAYNKSNSCVNDAVDNYFVHGTVPSVDPNC